MSGTINEVSLNDRLRERARFTIQARLPGLGWTPVGYAEKRDFADNELARMQSVFGKYPLRVRPITGEMDERISNGARLVGLRLARDAGMVQNTEEVDTLLAQMDKAAALAESIYESGPERVSRAELKRMDRVRKRREKRGRGKATGAQRIAAKRNAKVAARANLRASTKRKTERTQRIRDRVRGK